MITHASLLSLPLALFTGTAVAQTSSWPIVDGHQLQPTQQQVDGRRDDKERMWDRRVQPELDRIYDELTRESTPRKR